MSHDHVTLVDKESDDEISQAVQFLHENGECIHSIALTCDSIMLVLQELCFILRTPV